MYERIYCLFFLLPAFFISVSAQTKAVVTNANAAVREKPGTKATVKFTVKKGTQVRIEKSKSNWRYIVFNKNKGWIHESRIKILIDNSSKNAVWLFVGQSQRVNGFSVTFHLNVTQIVRNGNIVNFWTKMTPDRPKPYLSFLMTRMPDRNPVNFNYNIDLWEGNCSTKSIQVVRSQLYWKNGAVSTPEITKAKVDAGSKPAAKIFLQEACKVAKKM